MKLIKFSASGVNGHLNFDIKFNDELTFITGINGSGKTTALNCIVSLIFPKLDFLATENYSVLVLEISLGDKDERVFLTAQKKDEVSLLKCSKYKNADIEISPFIPPEGLPAHRYREHEDEYYKELFAKNSKNPVLQFIEKLPTPMYLGLDRRALSLETDRYGYYAPPLQRRKRRRNIFARSLGQSLDEALYFARTDYRNNQQKLSRLDAKLRENLVLSLIHFPPISFDGTVEYPGPEDFLGIEEARKNLQRLPELLGVSKELISNNVDPMFEFLDEKITILNRKKREKKDDDEGGRLRFLASVEWTFNKTHLSKLNKLSEEISYYNEAHEEIFRISTAFLDKANSFLKDSGKILKFDAGGDLVYSQEGEIEDRDIRSLSSGEIQLIVILTHLFFNPEVRLANVFIIDEPELSLHVQWQEKFVDGLMSSAIETQFILATHSPSIILNRVSNCIEITALQ